jgi:hypothetical protein
MAGDRAREGTTGGVFAPHSPTGRGGRPVDNSGVAGSTIGDLAAFASPRTHDLPPSVEYLTARQAAARLQVSPDSLRTLAALGKVAGATLIGYRWRFHWPTLVASAQQPLRDETRSRTGRRLTRAALDRVLSAAVTRG